MPSSAASALMEKLRVELEDLIEQLSELAEAKRMYGSVRPAPGAHRAGHTPRRPDATGEGRQAAPGAAADAQGARRDQQQQQQQQQSAGHGGQQRLGPEDEAALLQRADECSTRMLALLSDEPHAATRHQPLRGAALLAAGLVAFLRGGASDAAVSGLQAAVKLRPLNPTAWNCLAHSYWERGDLFMAGCCLASGLRHCPSVAAHQMMSLLVRQQGGAAGAALLQPTPVTQPLPQQQQQQQQQSSQAQDRSNSNAGASTSSSGAAGGSGAAAAASGRTGASAAAPAAGPVAAASWNGSSVHATNSSSYSTNTSGGGAGPAWSSAAAPPGAASEATAALTASLSHARRALDMDIENGYSWYVLAMAQMAAYFKGEHAAGLWGGGGGGGGARGGRGELHRVLAAFAQAERCGCADLPDLHYNRAALHAFTQDFAAALQDYATAARLDPGLAAVAAAQSESLLVLLGQLAGLVAGRGGVKERHWAAVTALLAADAARGAELLPRMHHERLALRTLTDLVPGSNRGVVLLCRPLVFVAPPLAASSSGTLYLVCVDTAGAVLALALTHIPHDAFDMTALLAVLHPELRHVHVTWPPPPPPPHEEQQQQQPSSSPQNEPAGSATGPGPGQDQSLPTGVARWAQPGEAEAAAAEPGAGGSAPPAAPVPAAAPPAAAPRAYSFPLLLVGCDPGCRSSVLVDGVPLHQAPATPLLRHMTRAA